MLTSLKPSLQSGFPPHSTTNDPKNTNQGVILSGTAWGDLKNQSSLLGAGAAPLGNPAPGPGGGCSIPSLNNSDSWTHQKTWAVPSDSLPPGRQSVSKKSFCANHSGSISHVCPFLAETARGICVIRIAFPCTLIHPGQVNLQLYLIFLQRWSKTELLLLAKRNGLKCNFHPLYYFIDNTNVPDTPRPGWLLAFRRVWAIRNNRHKDMTGRSNITDMICKYIYIMYIYLYTYTSIALIYISLSLLAFFFSQTNYKHFSCPHEKHDKSAPKSNPKVAQPCTFLVPCAHILLGHILGWKTSFSGIFPGKREMP